ncbi:unnamed protein product [Brachionus calyciflorus]|uniref:Sugar phosphate transporter domain-containing protein n=1 Tax=Brachionus calyciflorus TaxID=104777 RepID=A0A813M9L1_9BILA|nr:unnamed protein product [Brachionus calyciflorus]
MSYRNLNAGFSMSSTTTLTNQNDSTEIKSESSVDMPTRTSTTENIKEDSVDYKINFKRILSIEKIKNFNKFIKNEFDAMRHAVEDDIDQDEDYHNRKPIDKNTENKSVIIERQGGLANQFVLFLLFLWYFFSALTLYTNKYIVTTRKIDPTLIGTAQMLVTSLFGFFQLRNTHWKHMHATLSNFNTSSHHYASIWFWKNMFIIGLLRLFSIVLGLMALKQSTISFVETVKSSSPIFTVIVSKLVIGEITGFWTKISLFPIMLGLALCSSFELNFSFFGFLSAITTNFTECLQNVYSKLLLCSDRYKFSPLEVQFFSSTASVLVLIPICYFSVTFTAQTFGFVSIVLFLINGLSFHAQTLLAFTLMSYISPVTYSVCNTVKRAFLIWFSVYIFQNQVGYMSAIGTLFVIIGVLLYNHAKNFDSKSIKETAMHKV